MQAAVCSTQLQGHLFDARPDPARRREPQVCEHHGRDTQHNSAHILRTLRAQVATQGLKERGNFLSLAACLLPTLKGLKCDMGYQEFYW